MELCLSETRFEPINVELLLYELIINQLLSFSSTVIQRNKNKIRRKLVNFY